MPKHIADMGDLTTTGDALKKRRAQVPYLVPLYALHRPLYRPP
jgi:hypothetical protein